MKRQSCQSKPARGSRRMELEPTIVGRQYIESELKVQTLVVLRLPIINNSILRC